MQSLSADTATLIWRGKKKMEYKQVSAYTALICGVGTSLLTNKGKPFAEILPCNLSIATWVRFLQSAGHHLIKRFTIEKNETCLNTFIQLEGLNQ